MLLVPQPSGNFPRAIIHVAQISTANFLPIFPIVVNAEVKSSSTSPSLHFYVFIYIQSWSNSINSIQELSYKSLSPLSIHYYHNFKFRGLYCKNDMTAFFLLEAVMVFLLLFSVPSKFNNVLLLNNHPGFSQSLRKALNRVQYHLFWWLPTLALALFLPHTLNKYVLSIIPNYLLFS